MPNLPESFLALFAGPDRAAAMMGDLTEMAQTRGSGWFAAAYARTLFSLTWRLVLALVVADVGRQMIFDLFHLYIRHTPAEWRNATGSWLDLLNSAGPLLACIMSTLWFALPFAAVRYGVRDRFVQLTVAIAVGATVAFLAIPFASLLVAAATLALAGVAFLSRTWRKPLEVLIWTGAAGLLLIATTSALQSHFPHALPLGRTFFGRNVYALLFQTGLLALAVVCSRMHKLLLEPPAFDDPTPA
jgi:hypothetical protein